MKQNPQGLAGNGEPLSVEVEAPGKHLPELFGQAWPAVDAFAELLELEGELRGLIGPRELPRLWTRHIVNSATVVSFVSDGDSVIDVGSGAGFPGLVIAAMRPGSRVHLVETMERRAIWLSEAAEVMGLRNVTVHKARAEELHGTLSADVVTARAVANMSKLLRWCMPLVAPGGRLLALKGAKAHEELDAATKVLRQVKAGRAIVHQDVKMDPQGEGTTIVEVAAGRR